MLVNVLLFLLVLQLLLLFYLRLNLTLLQKIRLMIRLLLRHLQVFSSQEPTNKKIKRYPIGKVHSAPKSFPRKYSFALLISNVPFLLQMLPLHHLMNPTRQMHHQLLPLLLMNFLHLFAFATPQLFLPFLCLPLAAADS